MSAFLNTTTGKLTIIGILGFMVIIVTGMVITHIKRSEEEPDSFEKLDGGDEDIIIKENSSRPYWN